MITTYAHNYHCLEDMPGGLLFSIGIGIAVGAHVKA